MNAASGMDSLGTGMAGPGEPITDLGEMNKRLNTSIYDYFLKIEQVELAEMMVNRKVDMNLEPNGKNIPNRKEVNGDVDMKDETAKRIQNLPKPSIPFGSPDGSFLSEWWAVFWEMFNASRRKGSTAATQYLMHSQHRAKTNQNMQLRAQGINPQFQQMPNGMANGMSNGNLQRMAIINNNRSLPPALTQQGGRNMQMQQLQQQQQMNQTNMQRDGSEQHPSSPMSGDNAPSPKRLRVDGSTFNGQPMGRPPMAGMPMANGNGAVSTLSQAGINPNQITQAQFQNLTAGAGKNLSQQQYAQQMAAAHNKNMSERMPGNAQNGASMHDSPMMNPGAENMGMDFYAGGQPPGRNAMTDAAAAQGGQNALHDYQVQLILLEQQNKRRLIQARHEQEQSRDPSMMSGTMGPIGMTAFAPGMSPQGSRTGQSPNPDQMKRGTPKMGGNSPLPDGTMQGRGSPGAMNFESGQFNPNMNNPIYAQMGLKPEGMGAGPNIRPPSSVPNFMPNAQMNAQQMEMMRRNGMQNGLMQGQMHPQMGSQPQQPQENPQQRNAMPPPQAPPATGNGRTQPSSPSQPPAPPTPSQTNKPNPKKKDTKETKKKAPKKAPATTGATPSSEVEQPPTPTPQTPITPVHPKSFTQNATASQSGNGQNQVSNDNASSQATNNASQQDNNSAPPFGNIDGTSGLGFDGGMDFGSIDSSDVLEAFDFSAFLNTDSGETTNYDFDPNQFTNLEGLETSAGDA